MHRSCGKAGMKEKEWNPAGGLLKRQKTFFILSIIILYAALVSAILYNQQKESPFSRHPVTDEEAYVLQAKGILDGSYPGERIFYQSPLYPYFLASVFFSFGEQYDIIRIFQSLFTLLSIFFLYFLVKIIFGERAGLVAAGLMALYGPILNYQVLLLKVNPFLLFLVLFLLIGASLTRDPAGWWKWLFMGVLCSFLLLLYDVMQLFLIIVPVWILVLYRKRKWRWKITRIMLFLLGATIILSPLVIRNKIVADEWVVSTSQGGANFFIGNNPIADGRYTVLPFVRPHPKTEELDFRTEAEKRTGHTLKPTEISGFWFRQGFIFIKNNPGKWLSLLWRKVRYFFNNYEIPDNHGFTFDRRHFLQVLFLTPLSFGIIFPLAVYGICRSWRKWREYNFLLIFMIVYTSSICAFFVVGRYRIPVVIGMIPFAASGIVSIWESLKSRRFHVLASAAAIICAAAIFAYLPTETSRASWSTEYYLLGNAYLKDADRDYTSGKIELAKIYARKSEKYFTLSLQMSPRNDNARKSLKYAQEILGEKKGPEPSSPSPMGKAASALPTQTTSPQIRNEFIDDSVMVPPTIPTKNRYDEVLKRLKEDVSMHPDNAQSYFQLGLLYASRAEIRDFNEATKYLKKALDLDPKFADAWNVLGNIAYLRGKMDEARSHYLRALTLVPDSPAYKQNLALTYQSEMNSRKGKE